MSKKCILIECKNCKFYVKDYCSYHKMRVKYNFYCSCFEILTIGNCYIETLPE